MKLSKIAKWAGGVILVLLIALVATPFLFKSKIQELVVETINKNLKAKVAFDAVDLNLFQSFPKATVVIKNLSIVGQAPFEGDTLLKVEDLGLRMSVMELFKSKEEPMNIIGMGLQNATVNILVNAEGLANYDIVLADDEPTKQDEPSAPFALSLDQYSLENVALHYTDVAAKMQFAIENLNHKGSGNLVDNQLQLDTETEANLSFEMDGTRYLKDVKLALKALIGMDLDKQLYSFKENEALINQLPLQFDGSIQLATEGQVYDLTFATPNSSFKNFLGLLPEAYAGSLDGVKTTGDFKVAGKVKGTLTETTIPTLHIEMASNNASFQYPDLPKSVEKIVLDASIVNETGIIKDTYVALKNLSFQIDQDVFKASADIRNLTENAKVDAKLDGVINLANLTKAYPVQLEKPLTGILKAHVATHFDMQSVEKNQYQNIKNAGTIQLQNFEYESEEMAKPLHIKEAGLAFNPNQVRLTSLQLRTGTTDLQATGTLDNFYGFMFSKQNLKGNFDLKSNNFVVADVLKADEQTTAAAHTETAATTSGEPLKIPAFLDCTLQADAKNVTYDDLKLKNVKGTLVIKDQKAHLRNMSTQVFDGTINFDGTISTQQQTPDFDMTLGLQALDIAQSFQGLGVLKAIAPIAGVLNGKINSTVKLNGKLDAQSLSPMLNTLSGDLLGQLMNTSIKAENSQLLKTLESKVDFIDLDKLNLNNLKAHLTFDDGKVQVKPFDIKYQDIAVVVKGEHGFDQSMNYKLDFDVPVRYLGKEVSGLLAKLSPTETNKLGLIPVNVGVTGSFSKPQVNTDLAKVGQLVANQILEQQKGQLVDKGKDLLDDLLGGGKKDKNQTESETTEGQEEKKDVKEELKDKVGQGIKDLFGRKK